MCPVRIKCHVTPTNPIPGELIPGIINATVMNERLIFFTEGDQFPKVFAGYTTKRSKRPYKNGRENRGYDSRNIRRIL